MIDSGTIVMNVHEEAIILFAGKNEALSLKIKFVEDASLKKATVRIDGGDRATAELINFKGGATTGYPAFKVGSLDNQPLLLTFILNAVEELRQISYVFTVG